MIPEGFKNNMTELIGEDEYRLLEASYNEESIHGLRLNPLKKKADDAADLVDIFRLERMPFTETGYYFGRDSFPGRSPFHDAGAYYIQDPGAMIPAKLLAESGLFFTDKDLKILDLCASPGGKSTQIASVMRGRGILVCNEIVRQRAEILSRNIERMGIENAIVTNESPEKLAEYFEGFFDAIIVDAPCSGEGMFRKDPGAIDEWSEENVQNCVTRQRQILAESYKMLRPGGMMVYSTCTFERCENEDMVMGFIEGHPDMKTVDTSSFISKVPGAVKGLSGCENAVRIWPMHFKGEGQFAALLQKEGDAEGGLSLKGMEMPTRLKDKKILNTFLNETLNEKACGYILKSEDRFRLYGDNLYIMPENAPNMSGLKVLRNGLCIGTFKKDRFEPSHALALFLSENDAKCFKRVDEDDAEQYVHGMTLEGEGNGWCIISVSGYPLGWGKASGGRIKNHYPKGLRIQ